MVNMLQVWNVLSFESQSSMFPRSHDSSSDVQDAASCDVDRYVKGPSSDLNLSAPSDERSGTSGRTSAAFNHKTALHIEEQLPDISCKEFAVLQ
jgi:hypothetical protein